MRKTPTIVAVLSVLFVCLWASGQEAVPPPASQNGGFQRQEPVHVPPGRHAFRPKLTMQNALKIAEGYIEKEHIDIAPYWLYRATWFLRGGGKNGEKKQPYWSFWWVSQYGTLGDDVIIVVSMDGVPSRAGTM